jgi:hypothetical protein
MMKIERVLKSYDDKYWAIYCDNGNVYTQRRREFKATDYPMSPSEEMICALCEKLTEK